jgi:hypothetical protein
MEKNDARRRTSPGIMLLLSLAALIFTALISSAGTGYANNCGGTCSTGFPACSDGCFCNAAFCR